MAKVFLPTTNGNVGTLDDDYSARARNLAARATSKHGYPADRAIIYSVDVRDAAEAVIGGIHAAAAEVEHRSRRGDVSLQLRSGVRVHVLVTVAAGDASPLGHGGFSLSFGPLSALDACPGFEGQIRVDHIEAMRSRIVVQGRYTECSVRPVGNDEQARATAESTLRQIVGLITAGYRDEKI